MEFEQRRLEDFREELQPNGAPIVGALLCGAHFLEYSLGEPTGPLLLLEGKCPLPSYSIVSCRNDGITPRAVQSLPFNSKNHGQFCREFETPRS